MFKKLLITIIILHLTPSLALARGKPYLGAAAAIQNTRGYTGLAANAFLGYSAALGKRQQYYIASEIFGDSGTFPISQNHYHRTNYGFGASILPGFILNQYSLVYLRIGVETFRFSDTLNFFTGGQLGLGLQSKFADSWDIRAEYVYTGSGIIRQFGNCMFNFVKLGLVYKF